MKETVPLYNSRLIKIWTEYLTDCHPEIDLKEILSQSRLNMYEVEDPGHWMSQEQVDRWYKAVREKTKDPEIARKVGRYLPLCQGMGYVKQFTLGFLSPQAVYLLLDNALPFLTRGAEVKVKRLLSNKVEIISFLKSGFTERPYQCENRTGMFESIPQFFGEESARVEHPECYHRGDKRCRYIISWKQSTGNKWRRVRNYMIAAEGLLLLLMLVFMPQLVGLPLVLVMVVAVMAVSLFYYSQKSKELDRALKTQGNQAKDYMDEMDIRNNHGLLIQEIGQATSNINDEQDLTQAVAQAMEKRLDFDRGLIMLASDDRARLVYSAGYGYWPEQEEQLHATAFNLGNLNSRGAFVRAFNEQEPFLIDDFNKIAGDLSPRSHEFARAFGVQAMICVPIVYEHQSIGILAVDNVRSKRPLTQTDISLLSGIASQVAVSIVNARAFHKLVESEKKYRDLVENANSIILRRDISGTITFFNEFAQRLFGYREDEIIGKNIMGTIFADAAGIRREWDELVATLEATPDLHLVRESQSVLRSGQTVWIAWAHKPILDEDGRLLEILCIGNDISQLKRAQNEKKELEARLHRAQKMEALGTLAGGVAHDLNNILSGVVSYPELLLIQLPPDSPMRKAVATIKRSGEKATAVVQDLLTLARRGVPVADVLNLNDMIAEYLNSPEHARLAATFPQVKFEVNCEKSLFNISGSTVHLMKSLMNLVANAAEAMEIEGRVKISTHNRFVDRPLRGYDDVEKGDYSVLTVADTGVGIAAVDIDRIFEPFYTKKKMGRSGTGLGMAVVWGTVKDHKGYIDVQSQVGHGSVFSLYFPVTRQQRVIKDAPLTFEGLEGDGETILVVDDMADQREIAQEMLECLGYSVDTVASGEEAVTYMTRHRVDLLVLDMIMDPGIDGLETYRQVLKVRPGQKAIITSGYSETSRVKAAQDLGAGSYIKKPYVIETIGTAIRAILDSESEKASAA